MAKLQAATDVVFRLNFGDGRATVSLLQQDVVLHCHTTSMQGSRTFTLSCVATRSAAMPHMQQVKRD